jgi:transcriptional regulator with XRE-family HTH domain
MKKQNLKEYSSNNPNPDDIMVGDRLRFLRQTRAYSQEKLGDALGITFQQVQKYENATNRISASKLIEICRIFNTNPCYFFSDYDKIEDCDAVENANASKMSRYARLVGKLDKLPQEDIIFINSVVNRMSKNKG